MNEWAEEKTMSILFKMAFKWIWENTRSWKTTLVAISSISAAIAVFTGHLGADQLPEAGGESLQNLLSLILTIIGVNSFLSRDANVTSEQTKGPRGGSLLILLLLLPLPLMSVSCASSSLTRTDPDEPAFVATTGSSFKDRVSSFFGNLNVRGGISGLGLVGEVTVPPGFGAGGKVYLVRPGGSQIPSEDSVFRDPDEETFELPRLLPGK